MIVLVLKLSLTAFVFCVLGEPDMIFNWYRRLIIKLPYYLANPLGACHKCLTGQVCFWGYIFLMPTYNIIDHLFFTSLGIFLSLIYNKLWTHLE